MSNPSWFKNLFIDEAKAVLSCNSGGSGSGIMPTEPYVEYTMDVDGNIIGVALFGFIEIPSHMFAVYMDYDVMPTLKNVDFSGSPNLTSIGDFAFFNCTNLALTSLPEGLTSIGSDAFSGCTSLALTSLPESLTSISSSAFNGCTGLINMEIEAATLGTGTKIFNRCTGLQNIWIRNTCDTITATKASNAPFTGCSTTLTIYAEDSTKQSGWGTYFNRTGPSGATTVTVIYNQTTCPW